MDFKTASNLSHSKSVKPTERFCERCGGKLQSCGIRRSARRYRCSNCNIEAKSVPLSPKEIELHTKKDSGLGNASLTERYEEIRGIENDRNPYCLLPQYDPKYSKQNSQTELKHDKAEVSQNYAEEMRKLKQFSRKARTFEEDECILDSGKRRIKD